MFQPILTRRNTRINLEWRIRNLPYPIETYSVAANAEERCIVVRTTNNKYFKRLDIPELDRIGLTPVQANVEYSHKFNTLIITVSSLDTIYLICRCPKNICYGNTRTAPTTQILFPKCLNLFTNKHRQYGVFFWL